MKLYFQNISHSIITWKRYSFSILLFLFLWNISVYSQTNPAAFDLSVNNFLFNNWPATSAVGTYPAYMCFHITSTTDPGLSVVTTGNYTGNYSSTTSTRMNGLGYSGFSFVNIASGTLGAAVLALNTTGRTNIKVSWTGGTATAGGGSVCGIRLQYRITTTGTWTDVNSYVEYTSSTTGDSVVFGSIALPITFENNAFAQLRWKYYWISTNSTRPKLRVSNISVTSNAMLAPPNIQATNLSFSNVITTSFKVKCTKGNGKHRLFIVKSDSIVNYIPIFNTSYIANTVFGGINQLGTGNYCFYNGAGDTCTITGLTASTNYYVAIYEYNDTIPGALFSYLTPSTAILNQQTSAIPTPGINVSTNTIPDFVSTVVSSGLGSVQSFTVSGTFLTNNITLTPPTGFDISLSNSPFVLTNPITLTKDGTGTISNTIIYVRFSPTLIKTYSDSISLISLGATSKYIKITGKGIKAVPTNHVTNIQAMLVTPQSSCIKISWTDAIGAILADGYLIVGSNISYAAIVSPINGVYADSSLLLKKRVSGIQSVTYTGLNASTTYYFKIFPYSNTGIDVKYKLDGTIPIITITTIANGTITSPLTCIYAIQNNTIADVWVKGYIVGSAYSSVSVEFDSTSSFQLFTNIAIADSMNETNISKILYVQLQDNFLRPVLNIFDNHGNYHKQVEVKGSLMAFYTPHAGMQYTVDFKWIDSPVSILNSNWNSAYTWNTGMPGHNDNVTINTNVNVDNLSTCNKLSISPTGYLTIGSGNTLTIFDTTTIECGGSLIDNNSQAINAVVKRNFTSANWINGLDGWHIVSSPVSNQAISGNWISGNYDFYVFDEPSGQWLNQKVVANNITSFTVGKGYLAAYETDTIKQFKGYLNNNNVSVNLTYTLAGGKGYNLLGNPYPSAIKWSSDGTNNWNLTNIESISKIWNECNQTYSQSFNNDIIPSNQGFIIKTSVPVTGFIIPKAARVNNNHCFYKSLSSNMLTFNVSNNQNECKVSSYILFNDLATINYDILYDGSELQGSSVAPRLYSLLPAGEKLSVNALPVITNNTVINLGFVAGVNGLYTINLDSNNVTGLFSIIIKDTQTDSSQNLLLNPIFNFAADVTDNPVRFQLFLNVTSTELISSFNNNLINITSCNKIINISSKNSVNQVDIYNMIGQKINYNTINKDMNIQINLKDEASGIYVIKVISNRSIYTKKIQIN
ncbi:MAG: DUF6359 domain-containing protein [Bacteroidota bacterium]